MTNYVRHETMIIDDETLVTMGACEPARAKLVRLGLIPTRISTDPLANLGLAVSLLNPDWRQPPYDPVVDVGPWMTWLLGTITDLQCTCSSCRSPDRTRSYELSADALADPFVVAQGLAALADLHLTGRWPRGR